MNHDDERDFEEEAANRQLLEEGDEEEVQDTPRKRMKLTVTFTCEFADDEAYTGVTAEEARQANLELPIDTYEAKLTWELHSLRKGFMEVGELLADTDDAEYTGELIDDENDPNYLNQHENVEADSTGGMAHLDYAEDRAAAANRTPSQDIYDVRERTESEY